MLYYAIFSLLLSGLANVDLQNTLQTSQSSAMSSVGDDAQLADTMSHDMAMTVIRNTR